MSTLKPLAIAREVKNITEQKTKEQIAIALLSSDTDADLKCLQLDAIVDYDLTDNTHAIIRCMSGEFEFLLDTYSDHKDAVIAAIAIALLYAPHRVA